MSKRKGGTPEEELEDFAKRMISDIDDFDAAADSASWMEFVQDKIDPSPGQLDALITHRADVWSMQFDVGVGRAAYERTWGEQKVYTDAATGRFISKTTAQEKLKPFIPRFK